MQIAKYSYMHGIIIVIHFWLLLLEYFALGFDYFTFLNQWWFNEIVGNFIVTVSSTKFKYNYSSINYFDKFTKVYNLLYTLFI